MISKEELAAWREACEKATTNTRRCPKCHGDGFTVYGDTSCGRGGAGGQVITTADCHRCRGVGWLNADLKGLASQLTRAIEHIEELTVAYEQEDALTDDLHAETDRQRTRISTLERLCREACGIANLLDSGKANERDGIKDRISAILAAVEGES